MVNKEKAARRELIRLRKNQNPQQVDFKRMRRLRDARSDFWALKKKPVTAPVIEVKKKEKPKKAPKKKEKEPEMEIIEDEPELELIDEELYDDEEIDSELKELYDFDDEILDEEEESE